MKTLTERLKRSREQLLNLTADFVEIEKEIEKMNNQKSFTTRQINFKQADDLELIKKFYRKDFIDYKSEILELLLDRYSKKKRLYEKTKSEKYKVMYMRLKKFFDELSK